MWTLSTCSDFVSISLTWSANPLFSFAPLRFVCKGPQSQDTKKRHKGLLRANLECFFSKLSAKSGFSVCYEARWRNPHWRSSLILQKWATRLARLFWRKISFLHLWSKHCFLGCLPLKSSCSDSWLKLLWSQAKLWIGSWSESWDRCWWCPPSFETSARLQILGTPCHRHAGVLRKKLSFLCFKFRQSLSSQPFVNLIQWFDSYQISLLNCDLNFNLNFNS